MRKPLMETDEFDKVEYPIPSMILMYGDVADQLPDVTDDEMKAIANNISSGLMYSWGDAVDEAIRLVKQDREN